MGIKAGLVGLPNVGKSTLFNALTKSTIAAENYPFCTVDPNVAITSVPDERIGQLLKIFNSKKEIPTTAQFVDIAGLVKGASKGEGLGNQFLGHILEVDLILHVLRCFEDSNITHVHNDIDPIDDFETICAELMLRDLESVEKREEKLILQLKQAKQKNLSVLEVKKLESEQELLKNVTIALDTGTITDVARVINDAKAEDIETVLLLSAKNYLIIANLSEDDFSNQNYKQNEHYKKLIEKFGEDLVIPVSAKIECELAQLPQEEAQEFMQDLEITESGLDNVIRHTHENLNLITFFTCGPKEIHAWSVKKGTAIVDAAAEIHTDLQRGFICSEIYNCADIVKEGSEQALKNVGKIRTEGRDYIVKDGDIVLIRFNV